MNLLKETRANKKAFCCHIRRKIQTKNTKIQAIIIPTIAD